MSNPTPIIEHPMPRLAANIRYLFTEVDFLDRFAAVSTASATS